MMSDVVNCPKPAPKCRTAEKENKNELSVHKWDCAFRAQMGQCFPCTNGTVCQTVSIYRLDLFCWRMRGDVCEGNVPKSPLVIQGTHCAHYTTRTYIYIYIYVYVCIYVYI